MADLRRLVWLCRDHDPLHGESWNPRRVEHSVYSAKPIEYDMPTGRKAFVATDRARWLGTIVLPQKGVRALEPGTGMWVRLTLEIADGRERRGHG